MEAALVSHHLKPFPTASGAVFLNEVVSIAAVPEQGEAFVYAGAIAFSVGAPDNVLDSLLVEEPIDYERGVSALRHAGMVEEHDFAVGGPFGA